MTLFIILALKTGFNIQFQYCTVNNPVKMFLEMKHGRSLLVKLSRENLVAF